MAQDDDSATPDPATSETGDVPDQASGAESPSADPAAADTSADEAETADPAADEGHDADDATPDVHSGQLSTDTNPGGRRDDPPEPAWPAESPAWPSESDAAALGGQGGAGAGIGSDVTDEPETVAGDSRTPGTAALGSAGTDAAETNSVDPDAVDPDAVETDDANATDRAPDRTERGAATSGTADATTAEPDTTTPDTTAADDAAPDDAAAGGVLPFDVRWRRVGVIAAAVAGVLVVLYGLDLLISQGDVARGRTVAGIDVAGQSREEAERTLRGELDEKSPVRLTGGGEHTLDPASAGLAVDWRATLDAATDQPLNPFTRLSSLFTSEDIGLVSNADTAQLDAEIERVRADIDRKAAEGTIRFEGTTPVAVDPVKGRKLDVAGAKSAILARWAAPGGVALPVRTLEVRSTPDTVRAAVTELAEPAVSAPVTIRGEGAAATVRPRGIARSLTFDVRDDGSLTAGIDEEILREVAGPQLASTEDPGRDARFTFAGGKPKIEPSTDGYGVDWAAVAKKLPGVLTGDGERAVTAPYGEQPAELTTKEARDLGVEEVVGEFTTGGFAYDSGLNIKQVAKEVNGAVVEPGETFSLNEYTGPRGLEQGYVSAGVISGGQPGRAVGGGISQFATTLYNAYYFAGLKDVHHQEHSYYISRYPVGREATVFQNPDGSSVIDLAFKNDSPHGVVIQTIWTPTNITVKLWGTKRYEIESVNGGRYNYTSPPTEVVPASESCVPSSGSSGFSTNDTRIFKDPQTGEVIRRERRDVKYQGQTAVVCLEPEPEPEPPSDGSGDDSGNGNGNGSGNDGGGSGNDSGGGGDDGGSGDGSGGGDGGSGDGGGSDGDGGGSDGGR
ncbi:VanW family protein [Prauserella alba]|uniref:YoaR-like putative peptidoglycan binding domain-containing protein n=1 Tax=Prauserella alba TaxID=176898 RepID=A0ABN1V2Q4_9PSEU|nr:VanW family protein [Prauserella alba]MCP2180414.1 Vancomycin resistance protein YoaR, contains peptidoglycan-binding and VanW domains [Prauserella alba]